MDNILVIYKSIYGSTKKYAKWIAEDLNCNVVEVKKVKIKDLENYKTIIYGGGLYASGISGVSFIKKNYNKLKQIMYYICFNTFKKFIINHDNLQENKK